MRLCVFEDAGVANLEPLSLTRAAFDLWLGAGTLLMRVQRAFPTAEVGAIVRPALVKLCRQQHREIAVNDLDWLRRGPVVFVNARWLPSPIAALSPAMGELGLVGEELAYAAVQSANLETATPENLAARLTELQRAGQSRPVGGAMANYLWDLVDRNAEALKQDYLARPRNRRQERPR